MIVGLLAMLFMLVTAFIMLARFDRQTLQMTGRADRVTHILDALNNVAAAALRGARGGDLVSGAAYVDIPGAGNPNDPNWGSPWLASAEPVRDPYSDYGGALPKDYSAPAVTGLAGARDPNDPNVPLTRLMVDDPTDLTSPGYVNLVPGDASSPALLNGDTRLNARQPMTDADGDGIPDSLFGSVGVLTELANAMGGRSVHATGVNTASLNPNDLHSDQQANYFAWQQYDSTARYAVAAKIISHGGMVQVSASTNQTMWNTAFTQAMFNWIRHPNDPAGVLDLNAIQAMGAQSAAVEPVLRRRGGLLASSGGAAPDGLPPALWTLQQTFARTFAPSYAEVAGRNNWQRFNLASLADWDAWRYAAAIDPSYYDQKYQEGNTIPALTFYVPRQLLTTVNNSDELARIQVPDPNDPNAVPGFYPGKLKYYLGRITDPISGAFSSLDQTYDAVQGGAIVSELAGYYKEMLAGYKGLGDPNDPLNDGRNRRRQAYMLAVNTVAFAAPRGANGHVDEVYVDLGDVTAPWYDPNDPRKYIGYAPQPFVTQVVAFNVPTGPPLDPNDPNGPLDCTDPNTAAHVALAIELYNPYEAAVALATNDLDPARFAISVDDPNTTPVGDPGRATRLDLIPNLPNPILGRDFVLLVDNDNGSNTFFDPIVYPNYPNGTPPGTPGVLGDQAVPYGNGSERIAVRLWRARLTAGLPTLGDWYLVDEMVVDLRSMSWCAPWRVNVRRDCTWEEYLGTENGRRARWRMTVAFRPDDPEYVTGTDWVDDANDPTPSAAVLEELGSPVHNGGDFSAAQTGPSRLFGPCVPLHLMNAGPGTWPIHGAARPASFPTVGFMLFVPRFSHVEVWSGATALDRQPATRLMRDHLHAWNYGYGGTFTAPPADFGHMPVFDNNQKENGSVGGFDRTGRVPWGLLVFDYFTTLNPNDANGDGVPGDPLDPYRVPGRININDASWYVLAGLPLMGPDAMGNMPLASNASPAFWNFAAGVLAGYGSETPPLRPRYPELVDASGAFGGQWYRLGPYLAQAAAAYRDRVPYIPGDALAAPLGLGWQRNNATNYSPPLQLRYRPTVYGPDSGVYSSGIRGGGTSSAARGFLTLGELANVMAFDGATGTDITRDTLQGSFTVLGGYGAGVGGDFMKAVSLLALLDTHFLTTRSNTFTVYTTLFDREDPQASTSSQVTLDRSNLLPRLVPTGTTSFTTLQSDGPPELIARRDSSYFNAQYDQ